MTRRTRRLAAARERESAERQRRERERGTFRYYVHIRAEWGMGRPYNLIRVRGDGLEEVVEPGSGWRAMENALHRAHHWSPGNDRVVEVDAGEAAEIAKLWAYTYRHIVEASTGRTVAFTKSYIVPSVPMLAPEQSVCRSGIWANTDRLRRIDAQEDFYEVRAVTAATVDEYLRDRPRPEFRFFAVVADGEREFALNEPGDVLRVRTGDEDGTRERLGPDGWEPYDMIDGVEGLRSLTLLEIDDEAVEAFRRRPAEDGDQPAAERHYAYHEIVPERGGGPVALVRTAPGRPEEAVVGRPVWFRSEWLNQIAKGLIAYRARPVDADTAERFVRRVAGERSEYRYFVFLDDGQAIDAGRILVRTTGEPDRAEIQRADGTWDETDIFHRWQWNHEDRDPVEIPAGMAATRRR